MNAKTITRLSCLLIVSLTVAALQAHTVVWPENPDGSQPQNPMVLVPGFQKLIRVKPSVGEPCIVSVSLDPTSPMLTNMITANPANEVDIRVQLERPPNNGYETAVISGTWQATGSPDPTNCTATNPQLFSVTVVGTAPLLLTPMGFSGGKFEFGAAGPPALGMKVQVSSDLMDWQPLTTAPPFTGTALVTDVNSPGQEARYYRCVLIKPPPVTEYFGNGLVLVGEVPAGYGPGAVVHFSGGSGPGAFNDTVTADPKGIYTFDLNTSLIPDNEVITMSVSSANGTVNSPMLPFIIVRSYSDHSTADVPVNNISDSSGPIEPDICACGGCPSPVGSPLFFCNTFTPVDPGTELATGKLRLHFPILSFSTRLQGFDFQLMHASLVNYTGPVGSGFSHSYNMMVVQNSAAAGQIITPDLRVYSISSSDGLNWSLPPGFESTLTLNTNTQRWTLTHFSGLQIQFFHGLNGAPGLPVVISEPNGNSTTLSYNGSSLLQSITTDLGQTESFAYGPSGLMSSFTDHLGRTWSFTYDSSSRLTSIVTPETQYAGIAAGVEVLNTDLASVLVTRGRTTTIAYANTSYPTHITSITDDRGAVPQAWVYDSQGRVVTNYINGNPEVHIYGPTANPTPLPLLDAKNMITRTIDREGNITDYEIHSRAGGPVGGAGQFGLRRKVTFTATGQGKPALRSGEPNYYEQRWLQDCDCLSPNTVVQPFSSLDAATLTLDSNGIPMNWPRRIYTYNSNRQVTGDLYTDGTSSIHVATTYQNSGFGQSSQYSRMLSQTDPRTYDPNPIYTGLNFVHTYQYDANGNRLSHEAPTVTRGVASPQAIAESWTYNIYGQKLSYTDPNGDITTYAYYTGASTGGNINTVGSFGGYLASVTKGATGSADPVTSLTTTLRVNSLGMISETTDPRGLTTDYQYDNLGERILETEPSVTLWTGQQARYTTSTVYDGVGNAVLLGRTNLDYNGNVLGTGSVDVSRTYDTVNHPLSERRVVDANHADDLLTRFAYNSNDLQIVIQKPLGNRAFMVYDERLLPFRTFYGIAPGPQITSGYPASKQATSLGSTSFVGYRQENYDSRKNRIQELDGRGYLTYNFFDFRSRRIAQSDPNGNGRTVAYDAAGEVLTTQVGAVSQGSGAITAVFSRSYQRFDEAGRRYQMVNDGSLSTDESGLVNPAASGDPSYATLYDPGSRVIVNQDANGNPTRFTYDADNLRLTVTDVLGNSATNSYDADGNVVVLTEGEVAGPGAAGVPQSYVTTFVYDGNNRRTAVHILGLNGNSVDDAAFFAYDSRGNTRLVQDADTNFALTTVDYQNRMTLIQRYHGDPTFGTPDTLSRDEHVYDMNGNIIQDHSYSTATNLASIQNTQYAYDDADRKVRIVYPDSDNPIDGSSNGPSGIYNRVETTYDAEADPILLEEQRRVVFSNTFDPARHLVSQNIALTNGVPGATRQQFAYDARNLMTGAMNNYASVNRSFDALGRMTNETQSIRLDGSGFANGWEQPVSVQYGYDLQSNQTNCLVVAGTHTDLSISRTMDALNRNQKIWAQYFNASNSPVATYNYFGPRRIQTKLLGNGAQMTNTYDVKRRLSSLVWNGSTNNLLVGFQYAYDSMDNPQSERWLHDNNDYDYYQYNHRYELTGASYRSASGTLPTSFSNTFAYNDNLDRTSATYGGPFTAQPINLDTYIINSADEYTNLTWNAVALNPAYDRAGNMTSVPVLPVTGNTNQPDVTAAATWDAMNCLFSVSTGVNPVQSYRFDPLRRRIATIQGNSNTPIRRFIYDGWTTTEERLFNAGATLASAPATLERIYVDGPQMDEHLLAAIDRSGTGILASSNLNAASTNANQWFYFLPNQLGSPAALVAATNANQTLEYYRYTVYGDATVLPALTANNTNLALNFALGSQRSSPHGNFFFFTGQRFDDQTGLYYYRNRFYEGRRGRFVSRDPLGQAGGPNRFQFVSDEPTSDTDPLGLWSFDFGGPSAPTPPFSERVTTFSDDTEFTIAASLLAFYHAGDDPYGNIGHSRYDWDSVVVEGDPIDRVQQQSQVMAGADAANLQLGQDAKALVSFLACGESASFVDRGQFQVTMDDWRLLLVGAFGTSSIYWEAHCQIGPKACCAPDIACDSGKRDFAPYACVLKWTLHKIYNFGETGTGTGGRAGLWLKKLAHALQGNLGTTFHIFGYWQSSTGGRAKGDCCAPPCAAAQSQITDGPTGTTTGTGTQSR